VAAQRARKNFRVSELRADRDVSRAADSARAPRGERDSRRSNALARA
jgi:hypothetical protein